MSRVVFGEDVKTGRLVLMIGLLREEIDRLIGGDIMFLKSDDMTPDMVLLAGEDKEDLDVAFASIKRV